ncbi:type I toxin-antitoxin system toxin Ldr family protein [Escherichia coli]|nr:type I toxin-antitoxin system toxin Ldr family protein [Escherichia coli]RVR18554.1 type I toxin-antitoxin system toxin Ldr family protein [Escherichia coli]
MTIAELVMAFCHDFSARVIAVIFSSMIVNWLNKRK